MQPADKPKDVLTNAAPAKSSHAEREEKVLLRWKEKGIFEKSLNKWPAGKAPKGEFVFYEGPPTANGHPGIHHLEARAFKDAIPRYKTMRGYHVRRKGGWDTHGLPVELQVEKELGLKSKKEIDSYGVAAFNEKCKESVWKYVHEWEAFTDRMGYWVDLKDPYITYKPAYIEALWGIASKIDKQGLLYKDYKVVPWCPRCGTALSSHELAQGYEEAKDLAITVKFKVKPGQKLGDFTADDNTYLLAWTTTPWTLPGNVALAVGENFDYVAIVIEDTKEQLILAKERLSVLKDKKYSIVSNMIGSELVGIEYKPVFDFLTNLQKNPSTVLVERMNRDQVFLLNLDSAFKVYAADFVTTSDGTGIVHIAPMYGQDDFEVGTKYNLPKYHLVNEDGTFKKETGFFAGRFVKEKDQNGKPILDVDVIDDLTKRGLFFAREYVTHSYPFCWRCHTPLIYFARDSWYVRMSSLRDRMVKENEDINWEPAHIKEGRFGEWLREVKDWAISRERYWGTPLPVWICGKCGQRKVVGSVAEVSKKPRNTYYVMRHGEAENNTLRILDSSTESSHHLTEKGRSQVSVSAKAFKGKIDLVISSPVLRTKETSEIFMEEHGLDKSRLIIDPRVKEYCAGIFEGKSLSELGKALSGQDRYYWKPQDGESYSDTKKRMGEFLYDIESRYAGKTILIVTHETPAMLLNSAALGLDMEQTKETRAPRTDFMKNAEIRKLDFTIIPHNSEYELDLHRPFIDDVRLPCACGGEMARVKEVMDVWFDSGSMPFAQDHKLGEKESGSWGRVFGGLFGGKKANYPADFISEAMDQTRGWFYTLHAVGTLMGRGKAFRNVICLGLLLDAKGKKMSKSIGNVVNPGEMMEKYGADALRVWMYSVNQPGDSKNFDEKTVDEINKKIFNLAGNVLSFYKMYEGEARSASRRTKNGGRVPTSNNVLDRWILARLNELISTATRGLDSYQYFEPVREIRDFVGDLSQWYIRRSRDRFKGENETDKAAALATTKHVLITLAKVMAPFAPFFADHLYLEAGGEMESVHLEDWPEAGSIDAKLLKDMKDVRDLASSALEGRMKAKINVRQPLSKLKVQRHEFKDLSPELLQIAKDEVNVKEIVFDPTMTEGFELDTTITPALKEEGDLRELLRKIQDLRKEKGLKVGDMADLQVTTDTREIVTKNMEAIKKATGLRNIGFGGSFELKI